MELSPKKYLIKPNKIQNIKQKHKATNCIQRDSLLYSLTGQALLKLIQPPTGGQRLQKDYKYDN